MLPKAEAASIAIAIGFAIPDGCPTQFVFFLQVTVAGASRYTGTAPADFSLRLTRTAAWFRRQNLERSFGLKDLKKIVNFLKDRCAPSHVSRTSTPVL